MSCEIGEYGLRYDTPNEFMPESTVIWNTKQNAIPKKPAKYPKIMYANLTTRIWKLKEKSGTVKAVRPVRATIIISIGLTMFAVTAASPKISAPNYTYCLTKWSRDSDTRFSY